MKKFALGGGILGLVLIFFAAPMASAMGLEAAVGVYGDRIHPVI